MRLNGHRVGDALFRPGWTDYRQRLYYQTYDVTGLLRPGPNALGAILGDGWACGYVGLGLKQLVESCLKTKGLAKVEEGTRIYRAFYAEHLLDKIQRRWPEGGAVWVARGIILAAHRHFEEARRALDTAVSLGAPVSLPVTTTWGPVVVLNMMELEGVDQVIVWSALAGATVAPMVAPAAAVRMEAGVPDSVIRNGRLPAPAFS